MLSRSMRRRFRSWSSKIIRSAADSVDAGRFFSPDWVVFSPGLRVATDFKELRRFKGLRLDWVAIPLDIAQVQFTSTQGL